MLGLKPGRGGSKQPGYVHAQSAGRRQRVGTSSSGAKKFTND